jgi:sporulation protein YlmC with PRC-barrel domain
MFSEQPVELDVEADLLDRQLVNADGRLIGKVDDLELSEPTDGGPPHVTAVLTGPDALDPRLSRALSRWRTRRRRRRGDTTPRIATIAFGEVRDIGTQVTVSAGVRGYDRTENWLRDHLVGRIPGARHADR